MRIRQLFCLYIQYEKTGYCYGRILHAGNTPRPSWLILLAQFHGLCLPNRLQRLGRAHPIPQSSQRQDTIIQNENVDERWWGRDGSASRPLPRRLAARYLCSPRTRIIGGCKTPGLAHTICSSITNPISTGACPRRQHQQRQHGNGGTSNDNANGDGDDDGYGDLDHNRYWL